MLAHRLVLTAALMCAPWVRAAAPAALSAASVSKLANLLPAMNQAAQIMKVDSRLAMVALQQRVVRVGGSREALQTVMAAIARGEVAPYDARLGISRQEFAHYVAFDPTMIGTGKFIRLGLVRDASRLSFNDSPANSIFRGLSFDLRSGELRVPEGFTFKAIPLVPTALPGRSIDVRGGFIWNIQGFSAEAQNGVRGQVSLYQLGDGQLLFGYHRLSSLVRGVFNNTESEVIVKYSR